MPFYPYDRVKLRNTSSTDQFRKPEDGFNPGGFLAADGAFDGFKGTVLEGPITTPPHEDVPIYVVVLDSGQVDETDNQVKIRATEGALVLIEPASSSDTEFLEAREKYREMFNDE